MPPQSIKTRQQFTRIAAYGLVIQAERILLCRISSQLPNDAGFWTLPGGGINFGEDPVSGMIREVYEETGLSVRPLGIAGIDSLYLEDADRLFHGIRILYRTEVVGGVLRYEIDGTTDLCAWWPHQEAYQLPLVDLAIVGLKLAFP
jgi:ADP-ribose pyrophosphatase YjhB (NUDIX family)